MIIRQMEEKDLEQVCQVEHDIFTMPWSRKDFEDAIEDVSLNYLKIYMVAVQEEEIQGYCGLWGVAGEGQINNVAVKEEYRNRHIGNIMLKQLLKEGEAAGLSSFTLEVRINNLPAIRLYHNLGFEDAGIRKGFYDAPKEDAIIMWRYSTEKEQCSL